MKTTNERQGRHKSREGKPLEGLIHIKTRMKAIQVKLKDEFDPETRRQLWLEFEDLYFEFLRTLQVLG